MRLSAAALVLACCTLWAPGSSLDVVSELPMSWKLPEPNCGAAWQAASRMAFGSAGGAGDTGSARFLGIPGTPRRDQEFRVSSGPAAPGRGDDVLSFIPAGFPAQPALKLDSGREKLEVLVIDSANKEPIGN